MILRLIAYLYGFLSTNRLLIIGVNSLIYSLVHFSISHPPFEDSHTMQTDLQYFKDSNPLQNKVLEN